MKKDLIRKLCWLSEDYLQGDIKGIVLNFHGLGHNDMKKSPSAEEYCWSKAGGLVLFPYYGPWSWMNREARKFVDELVTDVLDEKSLPKDTPVISAGDSMGGCSSLLFARYSRHNVTAVNALYPVCDLAFHYTERPDVPRSIHAAFRGYPEDFSQILEEHSPLAQVKAMPDIPYLITHGSIDKDVNKKAHSDAFVTAMRSAGKNVEYLEPDNLPHGGPFSEEVIQRRVDFVVEMLKK